MILLCHQYPSTHMQNMYGSHQNAVRCCRPPSGIDMKQPWHGHWLKGINGKTLQQAYEYLYFHNQYTFYITSESILLIFPQNHILEKKKENKRNRVKFTFHIDTVCRHPWNFCIVLFCPFKVGKIEESEEIIIIF